MTSSQLVEFVERKLVEHGVKKVVPGKDILDRTYQLAIRSKRLRKVVEEAIQAAATQNDIAVPDDLTKQVEALISDTSMSWNEAVAAVASRGSPDEPILDNLDREGTGA
jgi:hypothetical protein